MSHRAALLLTLVLGGCAMSGLIPDRISDEAAGPEPVNYRFVIANGLKSILGDTGLQQSGLLEITSPHRVDGIKGATWMVCLRTLSYPSRTPRSYYAVFIQNGKIVDSRASVGIDQCERRDYAPFEWSADINNPILQ